MHRVVFPQDQRSGEDRYSIAYFGHPVDDTTLDPVPSEVIKQMKNDSDTAGLMQTDPQGITAAEHLKSRLASTYGWGK